VRNWREYASFREPRSAMRFIARFWARRDPSPGTPINEFRDEFSRRVRFARETLADSQSHGTPGFDTDRGLRLP
jgi:GWxTD domain-containing protein